MKHASESTLNSLLYRIVSSTTVVGTASWKLKSLIEAGVDENKYDRVLDF